MGVWKMLQMLVLYWGVFYIEESNVYNPDARFCVCFLSMNRYNWSPVQIASDCHRVCLSSPRRLVEVFYIPAVPFCDKNAAYVQAQASVGRDEESGRISEPIVKNTLYIEIQYMY